MCPKLEKAAGGFFEDECGWGLDSRKFRWGVGIVVRDSSGTFVAGQAIYCDYISSALHIEAIAAMSGVALAVERGFTNIIF